MQTPFDDAEYAQANTVDMEENGKSTQGQRQINFTFQSPMAPKQEFWSL